MKAFGTMAKVSPRQKEGLRCSGTTIGTVDSCVDFFGHDGSCQYLANKPLKSCLAVKNQHESLARSHQLDNHLTQSQHYSRPTFKNTVRFDRVEFRMYPTILSDNPSTTSGPPIGLGWRYNLKDTLVSDVDSYEAMRIEPGARRERDDLPIAPRVREEMLLEAGYSRHEIRSTMKTLQKVKQRRNDSIRKQKFERATIMFETARTSFKSSISTFNKKGGGEEI